MSQDPESPANPDYYQARAIEERRLAMAAKDSNARAAHLEMAEKYAQLAQRNGGIATGQTGGGQLSA